MTVWFTADQHFGHANIAAFTNRPVSGLHDMTDKMIAAWRARVRRGDRVYVLGDFVWKWRLDNIFEQLPDEERHRG